MIFEYLYSENKNIHCILHSYTKFWTSIECIYKRQRISNVHQVYQGLHICVRFAFWFMSAAESVFVLVGLLSFDAASLRTSVAEQGSALTSPAGSSVTFVSSFAFGWIRKSLSRAFARLGPLSVVLTASSALRELHSLLASCDMIQRSLPLRPSVISACWSTLATQRRKPLW